MDVPWLADPGVRPPPPGEALVAALCSPLAYPEQPRAVELVETHRAWVFLTPSFAYKLAKRPPNGVDAGWLARRKGACERELVLNRRLAPDVYLGVVPVTLGAEGWRLEAAGPPADWALKMRRLPRELMLDAAIRAGTLTPGPLDALADVLERFHASAEPAPEAPEGYRARLLADVERKAASLAKPAYQVRGADREQLSGALASWLAREAPSIEARASSVVDGHGDLRPEHVCLESPPVVIDCLEFERGLRLLDPLSEVAFLALECRRLGAAWAGERLLSRFTARLGDRAERLARFYEGYHALVRAAVAIWHLDDPASPRPDAWRRRAEEYLALGVARLAPGGAVPPAPLEPPARDAGALPAPSAPAGAAACGDAGNCP